MQFAGKVAVITGGASGIGRGTALALARRENDITTANAGEHFKQLCARRGLAYDAVLVRKAYDAVQVASVARRRAHDAA